MTDIPDRPQPQPGILKIAPYVQGRSDAVPGVTPVKLSANESPLGASPRAIAAYEALSGKLDFRPDPVLDLAYGFADEIRDALSRPRIRHDVTALSHRLNAFVG